MKYRVAFLIFMLPVFAFGQSKIRSDTVVINELIDSWSVGLPADGDEPVNIRVFNKFKSLFLPEATVYDDINAIYNPASLNDPNPYKTETDSVEVYAHDLALEFENLRIDTYGITYNTDRLSSDSIITVRLTKKISGEKYRQYIIEDIPTLVDSLINYKIKQDKIEKAKENEADIIAAIENQINDRGNRTYRFESTNRLLITMVVKNDTIKISSISNDESIDNVHCVNDSDKDGVIDEEDSCKDDHKRGDLTALGCLDSDLDGVPDSRDECKYIYGQPGNHGCPMDYFTSNFDLSGFVGVQVNSANLSMPELDKLGYNSIDFNESKKGNLKNPSVVLSPLIGADLSYFFGNRQRKAGISLGITYTGFTATYEISEPAIYTFKSNDGVDDYRRRITLRVGSTEEIRYTVINFPLLFTYRDRLGQPKDDNTPYKWNIEFSVGPSYVLFNNTSQYNSNIDFEGLYQIDTINKDGITYYDYFDNGSTWNVFLTADGINSINEQSAAPGADSVFTSLNNSGYDFASHKNYSGQQTTSRSSFALNAKFNACYKFDDNGRLALKFGVNVVIAPLPDQSQGYQLIDKTTDPYNSIYNGNAKSTYFSFGINAGIVLRW